MQEYDTALKLLLQSPAEVALRELTGTSITRWLNVELPEIRNLRMDLLGEAEDGSLVHFELQSRNEVAIELRMAEYGLSAYRVFRRFPRQILLYVGEPAVSMKTDLVGPDFVYRYKLVDIRDLDSKRLLESERIGDNVLAVLTRLRDQREAVHRIISKLAELSPQERSTGQAPAYSSCSFWLDFVNLRQ